ncbi:hypothetical protein AB0G48_28265 [Streptomyces rubiginosohelvolus]|uniref:hypothetical protein n=1 Tax=Streptomyces rubiginosohelvolus TaxID=67362 RepID=UPI0033E185FF
MDIKQMVEQLDKLIEQRRVAVERGGTGLQLAVYRLEAAIDRIALPGSTYVRQLDGLRKVSHTGKSHSVSQIAQALRDDLNDGWADSVVELVHADTHSDYLEMAESLLDAGYKDPSAVIAGTALEVHVRALCVKHSVPVERPDGSPKKADTMNADLKKEGAYGTLQQKQLTAWMDLRNKAAHGDYGQYDQQQVRLLIEGVRGFMLKHPA